MKNLKAIIGIVTIYTLVGGLTAIGYEAGKDIYNTVKNKVNNEKNKGV